MRTDVKGFVYTLHFDKPLGTSGRNAAQHYTGWCAVLYKRLTEHAAGRSGAKIVDAFYREGITFQLVAVEKGTRKRERQLKNNSAARRCPVCKGKPVVLKHRPRYPRKTQGAAA